MKVKNIFWALIGIVLLVSLGLIKKQEYTPVASAQDRYKDLATVTPYAPSVLGVSENALQKYAHSEIITNSAHGIQISVTNFRIDGNAFKADVCFQYPNNGDWAIGEAIIQTQNVEIPFSEGRLMESSRTLSNGDKRLTTFPDTNSVKITMPDSKIVNDGLPDHRCDALLFRLPPGLMPSRVKLTIKYITASPREGQGCYEYREATQSILKSKGMNIRIDCSQNDPGSSTRTRFIVVEKPNSMSQEEAEKHMRTAYRESYTIQGPWVFESDVVIISTPAAPVESPATEPPAETVTPAP
jgi:hypothetical protein